MFYNHLRIIKKHALNKFIGTILSFGNCKGLHFLNKIVIEFQQSKIKIQKRKNWRGIEKVS